MKRSTIQEVAKLASVSTATVSHVLNGTRFVSKETTDSVMKAVKQLSYRPNLDARNLKMGKRFAVGFIVPNLTNSYFAGIVDELEEILRSKGYSLVVGCSKEDEKNEIQLLKYYCSGLVDGIIDVSSLNDAEMVSSIVSPDIPVIFVDREIHNCDSFDTIFVSTYDSIFNSVNKMLINNPGKKFGCLISDDNLLTTEERKKAFLDAVRLNNLNEDEYMISRVDSSSKIRFSNTYKEVQAMIDKQCQLLLASTNLITQEALRCIYDNRLILNKDIDVIGFFNSPYINPYNKMTGIHMPSSEIGRLSAELIVKRINNPSDCSEHKVITSTLMTEISI